MGEGNVVKILAWTEVRGDVAIPGTEVQESCKREN
jgi:hypothetical protein